MCDPVSLTIAATAVTAVGKGFSAAQSAATYNYQAKIADRNAQLANDQEHDTRLSNQIEAQRLYRNAGQVEGQQRAAQAANGVDLGFGSAAQVQSDQQMITNEDAFQLYTKQGNTQKQFDYQAGNYRAQAQGARQASSGAIVKGVFDVGETVLGGATQYAKLKD